MTIVLDHTVVAAADNERAARRLADTLGLAFAGFDGVDGKFATVRVNDTLRLFFVTAEQVATQHLAFAVDGPAFDGIIERLRGTGQAFGNSPRDVTNGRTDHPVATRGVLWLDPDGHLYEVMTDEPASTALSQHAATTAGT
jgi:catechol 2,3-dioxygenase-like lactoylglutathione lyase family enzyme